ncbi:MAG TPA: AarF/UbiB family protein, partial [Chthoniobacterales bacterium]
FRKFSTEKVLTMEFMSGIRVDDRPALKRANIDPSALAERITKLIYRQIFDFGFFHGDPHPGNVAIQRDGAVGLYDYGMMGTFTPDFRVSVANLISGLAEKNHRQVMRSILEMSEEGYVSDPEKMLTDVESFSDQHLNHPLKDIKLGEVLNRLLELLRNHHLRMRRSFYLGVKALTQVEAIGRELDPELNFILMGEPYATEVITGKYKPGRMLKLLERLFAESVDFLEQFPHDFRTFYLRAKRGDFNIPLQHKIDPEGFEPLRKTLDSIANRLANAILAASVLICSSIIVLSHIPPLFHGISLIGIIGLACGGYLCLRLILSIWRHGGL